MIFQSPKRRQVGLEAALAGVSTRVRQALIDADRILKEKGVAHVLIGGIAVGAYGYSYATADVDFLVPDIGDDGSPFSGTSSVMSSVLSFKEGIPFSIHGVAIDYLTVDQNDPEPVRDGINEALKRSKSSPHVIEVIDDKILVYLKMKAGRSKDKTAVVELLKAGMDEEEVGDFLKNTGNKKVYSLWKKCVETAKVEEAI